MLVALALIGKLVIRPGVLALDAAEAAEHTLEIRVTEAGKKFTVTAIGLQ